LRELVAKYPDQVWVQVRDFPSEELHLGATAAAVAAACANEQGKYWPMHDLLFANQNNLTDADLSRYAKSVGVDEKKFAACQNDEKISTEVDADLLAGVGADVRGTPTFFVNGIKIEGGILAVDWEKILSFFKKK